MIKVDADPVARACKPLAGHRLWAMADLRAVVDIEDVDRECGITELQHGGGNGFRCAGPVVTSR
jgi:hypothetical protein